MCDVKAEQHDGEQEWMYVYAASYTSVSAPSGSLNEVCSDNMEVNAEQRDEAQQQIVLPSGSLVCSNNNQVNAEQRDETQQEIVPSAPRSMTWEIQFPSGWYGIDFWYRGEGLINQHLTNAWVSGAETVTFTAVTDGEPTTYQVDLRAMTQTNETTGRQRQVRTRNNDVNAEQHNEAQHQIVPLESQSPGFQHEHRQATMTWKVKFPKEWKDLDWWYYGEGRINRNITEAFLSNAQTTTFTATTDGEPTTYEVDFQAMTQKNLTSGRIRKIRHE